MKPKILVSKKLSFSQIKILEDYFEVHYLEATENLISKCKTIKPFGLFTFVTDKLGEEEINQLPDSLKVISTCAVGYNNISVSTCEKKKIIVCNSPDVLTNATADLTMALLLGITRRINEGENLIRSNQFQGWEPDMLMGLELTGKTLGIIGLGRIGLAVAKRAQAFGLEIIYYNRKKADLPFKYVELNTLIQNADIISIHTPANSQSKHLLTLEQFHKMGKKPYIINTSRGECIKEIDLVLALEKGLVSGAALDVFEFEPLITEQLKSFTNVILTPHIGSATQETREKMVNLTAQNLINVFIGLPPLFQVSL